MKKVKILLVLAIIIVGVVLFVISFKLGSIIKSAAEDIGPKVLGVDVTLAKASVRPLAGKASLTDLHIGNPEGFNSKSLFDLSDISVDMDLKSITSDTIMINKITIDAPQITYEGSAKGSNLGKLIKDLQSDAPKEEPVEKEKPEKKEGGKKVVIKDLIIRDAEVKFSMKVLGNLSSPPLPIKLKEIHLKNLGSEAGGATPVDISVEVLNAVLGGVMEGVNNAGDALGDAKDFLQNQASEVLSGAMKGVKDVSGAAIGKATDALGALKDKVGIPGSDSTNKSVVTEGAGKILDGVGGLFKKKDKDKK